MKIFRQNKGEAVRRSLVQTLETAYRKTQTGWVKLMERGTKNFDRRRWIFALVIYVIGAIFLCTYIILVAIR